MADTKHAPPSGLPVEGDGISYRGIVWFIAILTVVTIACQILMWGLFAALESRTDGQDLARAPLAAPQGQAPPGPVLLTELNRRRPCWTSAPRKTRFCTGLRPGRIATRARCGFRSSAPWN